jgi:hypothetical protein
MELRSHLCAPLGEATRREIAHVLEGHKADNAYWIAAQKNSGRAPPCCTKAMGIDYRPPAGEELLTPVQEFYSAPFLIRRGHGACGDICAYDAAALEVLKGISTKILVTPQGETAYHVVLLTPVGPLDPTRQWDTKRCLCHLLPDRTQP